MEQEYTFLGGVFPKDEENIIYTRSHGHIQAAANMLQWRFIEGIEENTGNVLKILSAMFVGSYPKHYDLLTIKRHAFSHKAGAEDVAIGFCNLSLAKQFFYKKAVKRELKRWAKSKETYKKQILIAYSVTFISELKYLKRIFPDVIICMIVPDLPEYTSPDSRNGAYESKKG
jgi:hypothetical protein